MDRVRAAVGEIDPVSSTRRRWCAPLGRALGCKVTLKVETLNPVRSFKGRGTKHGGRRGPRGRGIARGVRERRESRAGARLQRRASRAGRSPSSRRRPRTRSRCARSPASGRMFASWARTSTTHGGGARDADTEGAHLVEDSQDIATCEGAATIGLELVRDDPGLDVVLVAVGGGAMASGVGYVVRSLAADVEVVGIQPAGAPAMTLSWRKGRWSRRTASRRSPTASLGAARSPKVLDDLLVGVDGRCS